MCAQCGSHFFIFSWIEKSLRAFAECENREKCSPSDDSTANSGGNISSVPLLYITNFDCNESNHRVATVLFFFRVAHFCVLWPHSHMLLIFSTCCSRSSCFLHRDVSQKSRLHMAQTWATKVKRITGKMHRCWCSSRAEQSHVVHLPLFFLFRQFFVYFSRSTSETCCNSKLRKFFSHFFFVFVLSHQNDSIRNFIIINLKTTRNPDQIPVHGFPLPLFVYFLFSYPVFLIAIAFQS